MSQRRLLRRLLGRGAGQTFTNSRYQALTVNYENFFDVRRAGIDLSRPLVEQIQRVSFELSNICNYSHCHKKCPASRVLERKTLPAAIVHKVMGELSASGFSGVVAFHRYNEPLADHRLFDLVKAAKQACPDSKVLILTNGYYLTGQLAAELVGLGVWMMVASAYSQGEFDRLAALPVEIPYKVFKAVLDDREDIYTTAPLDLKKACLAPLRDLTVNVEGRVVLCCYDWQNRHEFGDLSRASVPEVVNAEAFAEILRELSRGERRLEICRRCAMSR